MNFPLTLQWLENGGLDPEIRKWQEELTSYTQRICARVWKMESFFREIQNSRFKYP